MSDELKPCPFCGGNALYCDENWYPSVIGNNAECVRCDLGVAGFELWNTRPIEDALRADVSRLTAELDAANERIIKLTRINRGLDGIFPAWTCDCQDCREGRALR